MTDEKLKQYKQQITNLITTIKEEMIILESASQPIAPDDSIGRLTRMEAIQAKSVNETLIKTKKLKLTKLEHALKRIAADTYGICPKCEDEIDESRLDILPETPLCIDCANTIG